MHYKWESVGDQDKCTRKICYLGPHLLEHVEHSWVSDKKLYGNTVNMMMMASRVWLWDDKEKALDLFAELPLVEYQYNESIKVLEDWYALNILCEELFMGKANEAN